MPLSTETPIRRTQQLGVEFWNDSCRRQELDEAVAQGACGATSNPVIVGAAVEADPKTWLPFVSACARRQPRATEEDVAWSLIEEVARVGAQALAPVHQRTGGAQGYLCAQVHPKYYRDPERMIEHGRRLATLGPNIAIKIPATQAGVEAMEELVASGIAVNATVSFTLAQAVACGEAMERGARRAGKEVARYVTLMVGRIDDHLKRVCERDKPPIDAAALEWGGIAVFKAARAAFSRRRLKARLLVAAYRHQGHWTELIGPGIVQSIPYNWWTRFNKSSVEPRATIEEPIDSRVLQALRALPDFRAAYEEEGLAPADFARYGASIHTLNQFIGGYHRVLELVRQEMFAL